MDWRLAGKTLLVTLGFVALLLGAVEAITAARGEGGSLLVGLALLVAGAAAAGIPIALGVRDLVRAGRAGS